MTQYNWDKKRWTVCCDKCRFISAEFVCYPFELFKDGWASVRRTNIGFYLDICERCCKRYTIRELGNEESLVR